MAAFLVLNPLVLEYPAKFRADVLDHIVTPNFTNAANAPIWTAQFADETVRTYWFTNLLPWNLGPALALCGLAGTVRLLFRHDRASWAVASYSICYYLVSSQTTTPYMRYALPLGLSFAIAAATLCVDLLERSLAKQALTKRALPERASAERASAERALSERAWARRMPADRTAWTLLPRFRHWLTRSGGIWHATTAAVVGLTWLWALAYMGVYRDVDPRLEAATFVKRRIAPGAQILVEPSHNTPPMGSYRDSPQFFTEYVGWGRDTIRQDGYGLHTLDVYQYLYDPSVPPAEKRAYIDARLAAVDYVVMDDTFDEFYEHLHGPEHAPVRDYYRDLFSGALGFHLMREFHASPTLFGVEIPDEAAEMTFSLFDHPDVLRVPARQSRRELTPARAN